MAVETLGAHLRNLLGPYQCLLDIIEEVNKGNISFVSQEGQRFNVKIGGKRNEISWVVHC